jgi:hypothetical protein
MESQEEMAQSIQELKQGQGIILQMVIGLHRYLKDRKPLAHTESTEDDANVADEVVPLHMRTMFTTAKRASEIHQLPEVEKTPQIMGKPASPRKVYRGTKEIAQHLHELKNSYVMLERSLFLLKLKYEKDSEEIPQLDARAEIMEEEINDIAVLRGKAAELRAERQNLHFWAGKRKKEIDKEIEQVEADLHVAQHSFNSKYHISLDKARFEVKRIRKEISFKQSGLEKKIVRMAEITKELDAIELEYRAQRQFADNHPDRELIDGLLEQMRDTPMSARKSLRQMQIERGLDAIADGKIG